MPNPFRRFFSFFSRTPKPEPLVFPDSRRGPLSEPAPVEEVPAVETSLTPKVITSGAQSAAFHRPIILAYVGSLDAASAKIREVLRYIEENYGEMLNDYDRALSEDQHGMNYYWTQVCRHAGKQLQDNGYLFPSSGTSDETDLAPGYVPEGYWVLTPKGADAVVYLLEGRITDVEIDRAPRQQEVRQLEVLEAVSDNQVLPVDDLKDPYLFVIPDPTGDCKITNTKYHTAEALQVAALWVISQQPGNAVPGDLHDRVETLFAGHLTPGDNVIPGTKQQTRFQNKLWAIRGNLRRYGFITPEGDKITEQGVDYLFARVQAEHGTWIDTAIAA